MQRGGLNQTIGELRRLYDTFASDTVTDRLKAQTAFLSRIVEDPELLRLILDAAIGNLESVQAAMANRAADEQLPIKYVERLRNGENPIKIHREYNEMTQQELADRLGVSQPAIARLESTSAPNCTIRTLGRIAESLGITVVDLLPRRAHHGR